VDLVDPVAPTGAETVAHCTRCGFGVQRTGDELRRGGRCNVCRGFDAYVDKGAGVFQEPRMRFKALVAEMKARRTGDYDCLCY